MDGHVLRSPTRTNSAKDSAVGLLMTRAYPRRLHTAIYTDQENTGDTDQENTGDTDQENTGDKDQENTGDTDQGMPGMTISDIHTTLSYTCMYM